MKRRILVAGLTGMTLALAACGGDSTNSEGGEDASSYPEEDITFIVQASPGGASDLTSRALVTQLEESLDTSFVVENRPGASGSTAFEYVSGQDPDGYTIGFMPVEISILEHVGYPDITPDRFTFLGQVMNSPVVLAVPADSPYDTLDEFIEAAQSEELSVANSGTASSFAAATTALSEETGAQLSQVPFDGGAPAVAAAVGNQVDAVAGGAGETAQQYEDGALKVLTIFADEPHAEFEGVETAADLGYDLQFGAWGGIYGPADLPQDVIDVLEPAVMEAAQSQDFIDTITPTGSVPTYRSGDEFTSFIEEESSRYSELLGE